MAASQDCFEDDWTMYVDPMPTSGFVRVAHKVEEFVETVVEEDFFDAVEPPLNMSPGQI